MPREIYEVSYKHLGGVHRVTFYDKEDADEHRDQMFACRANGIHVTRFVPVLEGEPSPDLVGELVAALTRAILSLESAAMDYSLQAAEGVDIPGSRSLADDAHESIDGIRAVLAKLPAETPTKKES